MLTLDAPARVETLEADSAPDAVDRLVARHWKLATIVFWFATAATLLWMKRWGLHWFALSDTDDNMRFDQVRDWINGQGWYDLRQYRLDPPTGFNIHWSRLVDLPLAAMMVTLKPLLGEGLADRVAVGVAPLLPLLPAMLALSAIVRRLVSDYAYPLGLAILVCAPGAMAMWTPMRIDHHGWQLAFLMITVAGMIDPRPVRSGVTVAVSSALSLTIGLEMLPYAVFAGAGLGLWWAWDRGEARRLAAYGVTMAAVTGACFLVFTSYDNMAMRCDALTPVWLTAVVAAALLLLGLSRLPVERRGLRIALLLGAGALVCLMFGLAFPQCVGHRLEGVSPELDRLWLSHVREARPITLQPRDVVVGTVPLPIIGSVGGLAALWRLRGTRAWADWLPVTLFGLFAALLLFWQERTGPSAQMLAVPGAVYLAWALIAALSRSRFLLLRVGGPVFAFVLLSGIVVPYAADYWPARHAAPAGGAQAAKPKVDLTRIANSHCPTIPAMAPLDRYPPATMFTLIDLGPRLITLTHHSAVAGPYHRNGDAILDVQHAFRGSPEQAHAIIDRHRAGYLLLCPHMSEATIYQAEAPGGFYAKLASGWTPAWLRRMPLPRNSPFLLYRVTP